MSDGADRYLARKTAQAKAVLFLEAAWNAAFPALAVAGLFVLASLVGLFGLLPRLLHIVALIAFAGAFIWALRPLLKLHWPDGESALRHLERRAGLPHRPATAYRDSISAPISSPEQEALWLAHKRGLIQRIQSLRAGWPRSRLARQDPFALRNALVLALIPAVILTGDNWRGQMRQATSVGVTSPDAVVGLDAWITPPRYTGRPPVFLAGGAAAKTGGNTEITVPANSELVVRFNNAEQPVVRIEPANDRQAQAPQELDMPVVAPNVNELRTRLSGSAVVTVEDAEGLHGRWRVTIIADGVPQVELVGDPGAMPTGALALDYTASDDYGLTSLRTRFELSDNQNGEEGLATPGLFLFDQPDFDVVLQGAKPRRVKGREQRDLTAHPWAGATVDMWLEAKDEGGQTSRSRTVSFTLPERPFRHPLAQALAEQRRNLLHDPNRQSLVSRTLEALTLYPEGLIERSGVYLGIRTAYRMLLHAQDREQMKSVTDLLWEIALSVEDGDLSFAERELQALQRELQRALAENAPQERIEELMKQLREALDRYMQALIEQARRNMADGQMQPDPNMRMIQPQDLTRMMDMIENLARSGARDAAQQLLAELNAILQGLRPNFAQPQGNSPMGQSLNQLGEIMGRQQKLMDQTYRMPGDGQQGEQGQHGQQGQQGQGQQGQAGQLGRQQGTLGQTLQQLLDQMGKMGMQSPGALGNAQEAMRRAAEALRNGQRGEALAQQGEALDQMRQGAESMAQQMQQGPAQAGNQQGPQGRGQPGEEIDPLGRPGPTEGEQFGERRNIVPDELSVMRAQEVLRILRQRMNEPARPQLELDYLERLLRGIY